MQTLIVAIGALYAGCVVVVYGYGHTLQRDPQTWLTPFVFLFIIVLVSTEWFSRRWALSDYIAEKAALFRYALLSCLVLFAALR